MKSFAYIAKLEAEIAVLRTTLASTLNSVAGSAQDSLIAELRAENEQLLGQLDRQLLKENRTIAQKKARMFDAIDRNALTLSFNKNGVSLAGFEAPTLTAAFQKWSDTQMDS